ncbi:MAG: hypothetical protein J7L15_09395 [Clostridiales bacterium]|nr:hypothetical protein [Clostridiales bacterium]
MSEMDKNLEIDYQMFVPRGRGVNYIGLYGEEFSIKEIGSMNIKFYDNEASYWLYFVIDEEYKKIKTFLKYKSHHPAQLLFSNSKYFIKGDIEVHSNIAEKYTGKNTVHVYFVSKYIDKTVHNFRPEITLNKFELLDLD